MGMLEDISAKLDDVLALLAAADGVAPATAAPAAETAAQKKAREKKEQAAAAKPAFTAEQLRDQYIAVQKKHGDAVAKALIAEGGHSKLADLIGDTDNWQAAWDRAVAKEAEPVEGDDNGGL